MFLLLLLACRDDEETGSPPDTDDGPADATVSGLVPLPALVEDGEGVYALDAGTQIVAAGDAEDVGALLAEALRPATGLPLEVVEEGEGVVLTLDASLGAEAYTLDVTEDGVALVGGDADGLFWGTQTLRQLLPPASLSTDEQDVEWAVPVVHIEDAPRFAWRGLMIDVARHFFTIEELERQVDLLALHKMNRLHLHLTDDQGWRVEITGWPDLAAIGGATEVGGGTGGYYTQAELGALIDYAEARHVTVVPEIDFPGHANAALSAYAELNEDGVCADVYTGAGVISTPLWLDGPDTYDFVEDVLVEVAALTSGPWLHVGGDEAVDVSDADYAAFVQWMQEVVAAEGKTMVAWDEVGDVALDTPFVTQHWIDADRARAAAAQGGSILSSPAEHAYLDMMYDYDGEYGQIWAGPIDIEAAYDWDPVPSGVDEAQVLGVEGALWTEYVDDEEKLDFMVWPRLAAHAELGWSEQGDWADFRERLAWHGARLETLGVGFNATDEVDWVSAAEAR